MSYMAIEVRPPVIRPGSMPRSCAKEDGTPKVVYLHRKVARRAARLVGLERPGIQAYRCRYGEHYHLGHRLRWKDREQGLLCARCHRGDATVTQPLTLSGVPLPPICARCAEKLLRKAAVAMVEAGS